jgi:hypothetical protein
VTKNDGLIGIVRHANIAENLSEQSVGDLVEAISSAGPS